MIVYSTSSYSAHVFQLTGSTLPRTFAVCIWPTLLCVLSMCCKRGFLGDMCEDVLRTEEGGPTTPFAVKVYAVLLGYVVVFRVNMAFARYWEGISHIQIMFAKWLDALFLANSFISQSMDSASDEVALKLEELKSKLAHWYSLMSALAILYLRSSEDVSGVPLCLRSERTCKIIHAEMVVRRTERNERGDLLFSQAKKFMDDSHVEKPRIDADTLASKVARKFTMADLFEDDLGCSRSSAPEELNNYNAFGGLDILGHISRLELKALESHPDKVMAVAGWIQSAIGVSVDLNWIVTPAPILTRTFQELSSGLLGFNQASKVTLVPFPFPFSQIVTLNLVIFLFVCPMMLAHYTDNIVAAPMGTLVITMGYWGLNDICNELENPYGEDANDLPLTMLHKDFVTQIDEIWKMRLPSDVMREWETFSNTAPRSS